MYTICVLKFYNANDSSYNNEEVAVKALGYGFQRDKDFMNTLKKEFEREIFTLSQVNHENIVKVNFSYFLF